MSTPVPYVEAGGDAFWPYTDDSNTTRKPFSDFADFMKEHGFAVTAIVPPLVLPTAPGTVIAIGEWWLVKLRPHREGMEGAWEFLPVPESVQPSVKRSGQVAQCVYENEWVQAEAEQEGSFTVIAAVSA